MEGKEVAEVVGIVVPYWAVGLFGSIILPWLVWLTLKLLANEKAISLNNAHDVTVSQELIKLYSKIEKLDTKMETAMNKIEAKIDRFLIPNPEYTRKQR